MPPARSSPFEPRCSIHLSAPAASVLGDEEVGVAKGARAEQPVGLTKHVRVPARADSHGNTTVFPARPVLHEHLKVAVPIVACQEVILAAGRCADEQAGRPAHDEDVAVLVNRNPVCILVRHAAELTCPDDRAVLVELDQEGVVAAEVDDGRSWKRAVRPTCDVDEVIGVGGDGADGLAVGTAELHQPLPRAARAVPRNEPVAAPGGGHADGSTRIPSDIDGAEARIHRHGVAIVASGRGHHLGAPRGRRQWRRACRHGDLSQDAARHVRHEHGGTDEQDGRKDRAGPENESGFLVAHGRSRGYTPVPHGPYFPSAATTQSSDESGQATVRALWARAAGSSGCVKPVAPDRRNDRRHSAVRIGYARRLARP